MTAAPLLVGVDVGGSKIAVLVGDPALAIAARRVLSIGVRGPETAVDTVAAAVAAGLDAAGATLADVAAIGVGVPGRVDPGTGTVSLAVNLGWRDVALGPLLEERFAGPAVRLENDVRAAAAGLHERAVAGDGTDLAYLSVGTGISAGVVLGGRLHRGRRGMAGEIGHVVVDERGPDCPCGLRGCLEAVASGPAVARQATAAVTAGADSSLRGRTRLTAADVYAAAAADDGLAVGIVERAGRHLARAVHGLVMTYDVPRVVVGGGVAAAGPTLLEPIRRGLDTLRQASDLARDALPRDLVRGLPPGADAGAWGALILARSALRDAPVTATAGRRWSHGNV